MSIDCPYCKHTVTIKSAKPGQYTPKCPKCSRAFALVVPEDPNQAMVARPLKQEMKAASPPVGTSPKPPPAPRPPAAADPNATGDFGTIPEPAPPRPPAKQLRPTAPPRPAVAQDANVTGEFQPSAAEDSNVTGAMPAAAATDPNVTGAFLDTGAGAAAPGDHPTDPVPARAAKGKETARATRMGAVEKTVAGKRKGAPQQEIPDHLGGYLILKELGRGGMGAVYLGRQVSLDRPVALKVMNTQLASDPAFVARFTREAYAAAQLVHHNVVQIYDIGAEKNLNFFSMEFVNGESLAELVKRQNKLDPDVAVGYILQAARGLKFGHDLSMIHRDVKPDNLMLNDQGIIKVADLGLVKVPGEVEEVEPAKEAATLPAGKKPARSATASSLAGSNITQVGVAMGTPAYMAPEQARDAARVDARADIYSLGCTLYALVTGKPPFEGKTALEVLTKHASDPVVPPEVIVKRVPKALSAILLRMMAKKPEDRYASMDEVIQALENYLGVRSSGPFTPQEEHANTLETCVKQFNDASATKMRSLAILGFFGVCALVFLGLLLFGQFLIAGGVFGLSLLTPLCYFLIRGISEKTYLFLKVRELVFGSRVIDWLTWLAGAVFFILVLYLLNLLWVWIGFCLAAFLLAVGFHALIDRQVANQRQGPIEEAEKLLRNMRLQGLDEGTVRQFVTKYSGKRWEEFYESLFDYESKLQAREWIRGEAGKGRETFAGWREPVIIWIESKQRTRREAKERKVLQAAEEKALKAQGLNAVEARQKAGMMAHAMVEQAAEIKEVASGPPGSPLAAKTPEEKRARIKAMLEVARRPDTVYDRRLKFNPWDRLTGVLIGLSGPKVRFLVGAALVAGCLLWVKQNDMISTRKIEETASALQNIDPTNLEKIQEKVAAGAAEVVNKPTEEVKPLKFAGVPTTITNLFNSFNPGVAGLILVVSSLFRGWKIGMLIWPAAAIAFLGLGVPALGPLSAETSSMAVGAVLALVGIFLIGGKK